MTAETKRKGWEKVTELEKVLGEHIKTKKALAECIGVTRGQLDHLLTPEGQIKMLKYIPELCKATGMSPNKMTELISGYRHENG